MVLVKGQAVLAGSRDHLGVRRQVLASRQGFRSVDPPGVCVRHVQLAAHRIGRQVVPVRRVVTAFKTITQLYTVIEDRFFFPFKSPFVTVQPDYTLMTPICS